MHYKFSLPIGDWSGDGHNYCDFFPYKSNKPVTAIREAHFKIKDVTGIDIERICSDYRDSSIDEKTRSALLALNPACDVISEWIDFGVSSPRDMANLWAWLLQKADPDLVLISMEDDIPMLPFYGFD